MDQAVEDGIGQRRIADGGMPVRYRQLAGDEGRAAAMPVIDDFQQITPAFVGQRRQPPVIDDQDVGSRHLGQGLGITAIVPAECQGRQQTRQANIHERQVKLLNKLLDGFEGKLTSSKWAAIAKCSPDTALRDINDLLARGVLRKTDAGGRSTSYVLDEYPTTSA